MEDNNGVKLSPTEILDKLEDKEYLELMNILLDIKEIEVPICLLVNRIVKEKLDDDEIAVIDAEMIKIVKMFHDNILNFDVDNFSPIAVFDALAYLTLSLHVAILESFDEYADYVDNLRKQMTSGSYVRREDFFDPSIR